MSSKSPPKGSEELGAGISTWDELSNEAEFLIGSGGTQPLGGVTRIIVAHLGQPRSWLTAEALETLSRAAQDLQTIENGFTVISPFWPYWLNFGPTPSYPLCNRLSSFQTFHGHNFCLVWQNGKRGAKYMTGYSVRNAGGSS